MGYVEDVVNRCRMYDDETEWFEYKKDTAVSRADDIGPYISALSNGAVMHGEPYGYLIWGIHNKTHEIIGTMFNYAADTDNGPLEQMPKYHISDINMPVFQKYLKTAKELGRITMESDDPKKILNAIEVADGDVLLNAGVAIFVDSGINEIQMVVFATDERLTILDSNRLTGSILGLTDQAVFYISRMMNWRAEFDGSPERIEIPEVPVKAIREVVINAFAHRLIESRQAVEVAIFKSYIEVFSPGVFPANIDPNDFISQSIRPPRRNPIITKTLYYSKDMEALATGLWRINDECTKAGVKYEFIREPYGFTVRFYRHCGEGWGDNQSGQSLFEKGTEKGTNKGTNIKKRDEIEHRIEQVFNLIKSNPEISQKEIAGQLDISIKQVKNATDALKKEGRIHREGPAFGGRWIIEKHITL